MKTIQKMIAYTSLAAILLGGCAKNETETITKKNSEIPEPRYNQTVFLHPEYLSGKEKLGYTLLTDLDGDGKWDIADKVDEGFKPCTYTHRVFFKKGYNPGQTLPEEIQLEYVNPKFFKPYQ